MNWNIKLIESIRSTRAQMSVPAGIYVPLLVRQMDERSKAAWERNAALIMRLSRTNDLTRVETFPRGTVSLPMEGADFGLPMADLIDINQESTRLQKNHDKLTTEIHNLHQRLQNPKFLKAAPRDVIDETLVTLNHRKEEETKIKDALARLEEFM